jgi:hypothetical protein
MNDDISARPDLPAVQAQLAYLGPTLERPHHYVAEPPDGAPWENYRHDRRMADIRDGRAMALPSTLDREGFALWDAPSGVRDFSDADDVKRTYYPELAVLARSLDAADLVEAEVRYPRRTGDIYLARHSPRHRWFYFSAMDMHEALVFKQYDSQLGGVARFTPHAAFDHPDAPAGAIPRISIEARCLVVHDQESP